MTLNPAQRGVVEETALDILTLACAGAGKTKTLIERIARRIETDTPPWAVLAVTFTNKAADEMRERLAVRIGKARAAQVWMGTFHALGNRILQEFHEQAGFPDAVSLYDAEDVTDVLRLCAHTLGIVATGKNPDAEAFRKAGAAAKKAEALENLYRATLRRYAATDYDGLELHLLDLLKNPHVIEHVSRFREMLVDEYQDTNAIQDEIIAAIRAAAPRVRVLRVGDASQCIPGGEVVHTQAGPVKIRDVAEGDLVLGSRGGAESYRRIIRKSQSQKTTAFRFHLDDGTTFDATPEHVCFAAIADPVGVYVYLMYSPEHGFRMGVTQSSGTKAASIIMRTQQECADRLWILQWFETREEAVLFEEQMSLRWQVPTVPFYSRSPDGVSGGSWSQRNIDSIFGEFGQNGFRLIDHLGLDFHRPNYRGKATKAKGKIAVNVLIAAEKGHRVEVETIHVDREKAKALGMYPGQKGTFRLRKEMKSIREAMDLAERLASDLGGSVIEHLAGTSESRRMFAVPAISIHKHMAIPVVRDGQTRVVKVLRREVIECSDCYDLEVEVLANFAVGTAKAVVHNCIYEFRGAQVQNILQAAERPGMAVHRLAVNYRSGRDIVEAGNRIAADTGSPLGRVEPGPTAGPGAVMHHQHQDPEARAAAIADRIQAHIEAGGAARDVMVLGRTWAPLFPIAQALQARGVPVNCPKGEADRWGSESMRWLVAAMRLWRNPRDGIALRRVLRWPAGAVTEQQIQRVEAASKRPILEAVRAEGLGAARLAFIGDPERLVDVRDPGLFAERVVKESDARGILRERGLTTRGDELDKAVEMLRQWVVYRVEDYQAGRAADANVDIRRFLQWHAFREVRDAQKKEEAEGVQILTVHAAKGLEADVVHFVGPDRNVFPREGEDPAGEELRLWYVGVTRARDEFHAHTANTVAKSWGSGVQRAGPSDFVRYLRG